MGYCRADGVTEECGLAAVAIMAEAALAAVDSAGVVAEAVLAASVVAALAEAGPVEAGRFSKFDKGACLRRAKEKCTV